MRQDKLANIQYCVRLFNNDTSILVQGLVDLILKDEVHTWASIKE